MNQEIMNKIQGQYNDLIEEYGEDKVLWVAATGPRIFNRDSTSLIMAPACLLPSENELYNHVPKFNSALLDIRFISEYIDNSTIIEMILSPYKIINPKYEEILNNELFLNKELFLSPDANKKEQLEKIIKNIVISAHSTTSKEDELLRILSKTELQILKNILKDFNKDKEGDIKVSQATEKYNASTAVFRTLFYKLKDYRVAEIDSRGVKGTHIKFNNINTLKSLIDKD